MWSREKLLHPATAIALVALFVSLGGVTYAAATIGTRQIKNGAVTNAKLGNRAVYGAKLRNGSVGFTKIARGAVRGDRIAREGVTARELQRGSVAGAILAENSVTSPKIGLSAVTTAKLADGAVAGAKLADKGVAGTKLADQAVTSDKLSDGAVTAAKLAPGTVVSGTGRLLSANVTIANAAAITPLLELPSIGSMQATCMSGNATISFRGTGAVVVSYQNDGRDPAITRGAGGTVAVDATEVHSSTWQVTSGAHVATAWVSAVATGASDDDCAVTVQTLVS